MSAVEIREAARGMDETTIAAVAIAALAPQWTEYWEEVPCGTGRVDVVGRDIAGDLHAVEIKVGASLQLAAQICERIGERAFRTVLGIVGVRKHGRRCADPARDLISVGRELGFGVGVVEVQMDPLSRFDAPGERDPKFKLVLLPRSLEVEAGSAQHVGRALNDVHRQCAAGAGSTSSQYWTLWKQGIHDIEAAVAAQPGIDVSQLTWKLPTVLYWNDKRAQVRKLAEATPRIRIENIAGKLTYYPHEAA